MSRWKKSCTAFAVVLAVECFSVGLFARSLAWALIEANRLELISAEQSHNHPVIADDAGTVAYEWVAERGIGTQVKDIVLGQLFSRPLITAKVSRCISHSVLIL